MNGSDHFQDSYLSADEKLVWAAVYARVFAEKPHEKALENLRHAALAADEAVLLLRKYLTHRDFPTLYKKGEDRPFDLRLHIPFQL